MTVIDELKQRLAAAPNTKRTRQGLAHLYVAETRTVLVQTMLDNGLEDRPLPRPLTYAQRLRLGLASGRIETPNAEELLADLERAQAGNRAAQERVISYLSLPGVLEALDDG